MKRLARLTGALLIAGAAFGCARGEIPLMGLDDNGNPVDLYAPESLFRDKMIEAVKQVHEATAPVLKDTYKEKSAQLRTVVVGLGFNFEAGIGSIAKVGASPKVRFAFSNSQKPIVP